MLALQAQRKFSEAEPILLELYKTRNTFVAAEQKHSSHILRNLVGLYDAWHAVEPGKGYDTKAAEWRAKLEQWQATTQPVATQSAEEGTTTQPARDPEAGLDAAKESIKNEQP